MTDNTTEKITEEASEDIEEKNVETTDELVKEKASNKFVARDNTAHIQIFVQNANFDHKAALKQVLDSVNLSAENNKKYDLKKMEDCAEFFSTCKNEEYIALAIVLSVFEIVPIGDYANLKDNLTEYLPAILQQDKEGNEMYVRHSNPYISLDTMLSSIGAKIFIMDDNQRCLGYGADGKEVLSNIWVQFPGLRKPIIDWLLKTNETFEYRTSFEVHQVISAFIRIIAEDFPYAERHVFHRLYSSPDNLGLLARLAQELLRDEKFRTDTLNIVLRWMESESSWLWKSSLLVCLHTYGPDTDNRLYKAMVSAVRKRILGFLNSDLKFIVLFSWNARNVRTIVTSAFYDLFQSCDLPGKRNLSQIYLKMIKYGYYQVNRNKTALPLVACDSKEQIDNMRFILAFIMSQYDLYCQLCWILQVYLEEISDYKVSQETLHHITAFFYVLSEDKVSYRKDILFFLSELKGRTAQNIHRELMRIYRNERGELK